MYFEDRENIRKPGQQGNQLRTRRDPGEYRERRGQEAQEQTVRRVRRTAPHSMQRNGIRYNEDGNGQERGSQIRFRSRPVEASYEEEFDEELQRHDPVRQGRRSSGRRRRRKPLRTVIILFVILCLLYAAWIYVKPMIGAKYWTVAVFGVDSRDGNLGKGALSDVIMVASINRRNGDIKIVSVYRDTYLKIDKDGTYHKLNEAYFKGGHEQALQALSENLDLKIDDYVTFNWASVAKAINALGGVDIDISDAEFSYINAFITETVNSTGIGSVQLKKAGANHLDGVQAVAYGRLRLMDTDFNRTARQRKILELAMDKAKKAKMKTLADIAADILPELSTSMDAGDISELAGNIKRYNIADSSGFPFARTTMKIGKMDCVVPATLNSNVTELHKLLYDLDTYTPSVTVAGISQHISDKTGIKDPQAAAEEAEIGGGTALKKSSKKSAETAEAPVVKQEETKTAETAESTETESTAEETIETLEKTTESNETAEETKKSSTDSGKNSTQGPASEKPAETGETAAGPGQDAGNGNSDGGSAEGPGNELANADAG